MERSPLLGDDPQMDPRSLEEGHGNIVPPKDEISVLPDMDPRSLEESRENIVPPEDDNRYGEDANVTDDTLGHIRKISAHDTSMLHKKGASRFHTSRVDHEIIHRRPESWLVDWRIGRLLAPSVPNFANKIRRLLPFRTDGGPESGVDNERIRRLLAQINGHPEVHGHFKVPHQLRQVNETAYEPQLISIGPCHRHKEHLRDMELIKMQCFSRLFHEKGEETMNKCLEAISNMKEKARNWYVAMSNIEVKVRDWWQSDMWKMEEKVQNWLFAASSKMKENVPILDEEKAFLVMILVDGCFIIQLLCKKTQDQFTKLRWSRDTLLGDLLLLENQLPFIVLVELYGRIEDPRDGSDFASQALDEFNKMLPGPTVRTANPSTIEDTNKINHLLGLVHDNWIPSPEGRQSYGEYIATGKGRKGRMERQSISCARELKEAGIEFIKVEERDAKSLFDVNFKDGKMKIPELVIDDYTERLFRNLIAYELFVEGSTYVIDYVTLMDNLVNAANDVQLLRSRNVIENMLGDDEAVAQMLNKLRDHVTLCGDTFFYEEIFVEVQKHCERTWNKWKAKLRHDYFSNPWAGIAFVAGLLVFLTTITTFILSFFKKS